MKANQKFVRGNDEAVSPVIAVILMVAITVVLAATVYVWVSGFGAQSSAPARAISLQKTTSGNVVTFTVSSASSGLRWSDIKIVANGLTAPYDIITSGGDVARSVALTPASTSTITAGSQIYVSNGVTSAASGVTLQVIDANANSVMSTITGLNPGAATAGTLTATASRVSGATGTFTAGVIRLTFSAPFEADTMLTQFPLACNNAHVFTGSTFQVISPTIVQITGGAGTTCVASDSVTLGTGIKDVTGAAITATTAPLTGL